MYLCKSIREKILGTTLQLTFFYFIEFAKYGNLEITAIHCDNWLLTYELSGRTNTSLAILL